MKLSVKTLKGALNELAKVYRDYKALKLTTEQARTRTLILRTIIDSVYKYEVENKLIELESKLDERIK